MISEEQDLKSKWIKLNTCELISLIEAGWLCKVNAHTTEKLKNHLQISFKNTAGIYDLKLAEPALIEKMDHMDELWDANNFIETGFKL